MIVFRKWPEDFHPASVKPIVNGDEATFELAFSKPSASEGHMIPWKNMVPMYTKRTRYMMVLTPFTMQIGQQACSDFLMYKLSPSGSTSMGLSSLPPPEIKFLSQHNTPKP